MPSDVPGDVIECPEHFCPHTWTGREELEAHLRWDHNRSEYKAEQLAEEAVQASKGHTGGENGAE